MFLRQLFLEIRFTIPTIYFLETFSTISLAIPLKIPDNSFNNSEMLNWVCSKNLQMNCDFRKNSRRNLKMESPNQFANKFLKGFLKKTRRNSRKTSRESPKLIAREMSIKFTLEVLKGVVKRITISIVKGIHEEIMTAFQNTIPKWISDICSKWVAEKNYINVSASSRREIFKRILKEYAEKNSKAISKIIAWGVS